MLTALRTSPNKASHLPATAQADTRTAGDAERGFAAVMQRQVELQSPGLPTRPPGPDTRLATTDAAPASNPPSSKRPPRMAGAGPDSGPVAAISAPSAPNASLTLSKPEPPGGLTAVHALGASQTVGAPDPVSAQERTPHSPVRSRVATTALQEAAAISSKCGLATLLDPHGGRPASAGLGALRTQRETARDPTQTKATANNDKPAEDEREYKVDESLDANTADATDTAASSQPDLQQYRHAAQTSDPLAQALMAGWQPAAINPPASSYAADPATHDAAHGATHDAGTPAQVTAVQGRPGVHASGTPPAETARQMPTAGGPAIDSPQQGVVGSLDRRPTALSSKYGLATLLDPHGGRPASAGLGALSSDSGAGFAARLDRANKPEGDASRGPEPARSAPLAAVDARPARPAATVGQQDLGQQDRGRQHAIDSVPGTVIRPTAAAGQGNTGRPGDAAEPAAPTVRDLARPQVSALAGGDSAPGLPIATPTPTATPAPASASAPVVLPPLQPSAVTPAPHNTTAMQGAPSRLEQAVGIAGVNAPQTPSDASADRATPGNTERLTETAREQPPARKDRWPSGLQVAGPSTLAPERAGNPAAPARPAEVLAPSEQFAVLPNRANAALLDHRRGQENSAEPAPHSSSTSAMPTPEPTPEAAAIVPDPIRSTERKPAAPNAAPEAAPGAAPTAAPPAAASASVIASPALAEARIAAPVDSPAFAPALGAQVSLFVRNGLHSASLQLNPAEMGPVSVRIALEGSTAQVEFQADRASTRQAIEASLPALAAALRDAGLNLAGGGVFEQHPGRQPPREDSAPSRRDAPQGRDFASGPLNRPVTRNQRRGLIDLVA